MKVLFILILGMASLSCKPTRNNSIDERPYFYTLPPNADLKTRIAACNSDPDYVFNVDAEVCCKKTQKVMRGQCIDMPQIEE